MCRPNIIIINVESVDGRKMGYMGKEVMKDATPNIDELANSGVTFKNTYSNSALCVPSRSSFWSGEYVHNCEAWNNFSGLSEDDRTFKEELERIGYRTKLIGPADYLSGRHSFRARVGAWTRGANIRRPIYRMRAPEVLDEGSNFRGGAETNIPSEPETRSQGFLKDWNSVYKTMDWLREGKQSESPFMLYLTTNLVHPPFQTKKKYLNNIKTRAVQVPKSDHYDHPVLKYQRIAKNVDHSVPTDLTIKIRAIYFAMISMVDEMVGQLLEGLDRLNLKESTYIIFMGDHGEMAMEHAQIRKQSPYESSIRVPLIISGPNLKAGQRISDLVSLVDLFPTIMDFVKLDKPSNLDGKSLVPLIEGKENGHREWVLSEFHGDTSNTGWFMVRKDQWKYIKYVNYAPLLFNVEENPEETYNRADENPDILRNMNALLSDIVDFKKIDEKAKTQDKKKFRVWREKHKQKGNYQKLMREIYSGWDNLSIEETYPWTDQNEAKIEKWLNS